LDVPSCSLRHGTDRIAAVQEETDGREKEGWAEAEMGHKEDVASKEFWVLPKLQELKEGRIGSE
jgi:hypothetical protein